MSGRSNFISRMSEGVVIKSINDMFIWTSHHIHVVSAQQRPKRPESAILTTDIDSIETRHCTFIERFLWVQQYVLEGVARFTLFCMLCTRTKWWIKVQYLRVVWGSPAEQDRKMNALEIVTVIGIVFLRQQLICLRFIKIGLSFQ
jgi:hypothetical protein